jgi:membrane protein required for colicin V production
MPHILDIIIALPLLWGAYKGFKKGLIIEVTTLAALILGLYGAIKFSDFTAVYLQENWTIDERYMPILSFAITFIGIVILVNLIGRLLEKVVKLVALGLANKLAGSLFRIAKICVIISVLFNVVDSLDKDWGLVPTEMKEGSVLYEPLSKIAPTIVPAIKDNEWTKKLQEALPIEEEIPGLPGAELE